MLAVSVETSPQHWRGYSSVRLEMAITAAASLASHCMESGYSLGLVSNGVPMVTDRPAELRPSRSRPQLRAVLETLATLQPITLSPIAVHLEDRMGRFPAGATVVVVTAYFDDDLAGVLSRLRARGHPAAVVYVGAAAAPTVPAGVALYDIAEQMAGLDDHAGEGGPG